MGKDYSNFEERQQEISEANSWSEYRRLVTGGLIDLEKDIKDLRREFNDLHVKVVADITELKTRASLWGGIFGFIAGVIGQAVLQIILKRQ